jgi:hypothetical protein
MNYRTDKLSAPTSSFITPEFRQFMHKIETNKICGWTNVGQWFHPNSIDAQCGYCQQWVNFSSIGEPVFQSQTESWLLTMKCIRCERASTVLVHRAKHQAPECQEIWMMPAPEIRKPKVDADLVDSDVYDAYTAAIDCYNKGIWRSVVTESGRVLEGITKVVFNKKKHRKALGEITKNQNNPIKKEDREEIEEFEIRKIEEETKRKLFKPLLDLSSAVRLGRLTGAHFKVKGDTTQEIAKEVLDLVEYELIYFFQLTANVEQLKEKIIDVPDDEDEE